MHFSKILILDLYKLVKKKTTYLLLLTLLVPLVFGYGMFAQISFLVTDGNSSFDVISDKGISALQFTANMLSQSTYIVYLIVIIIASMTVANEFEMGQIRLYTVRICMRSKMILSKILSLFILIVSYMGIYCLFSFGIYYLFVARSKYGNGKFLSEELNSVLYLIVTMIGVMVVVAITVLLGLFLKTFHCFSVAYLIWFISKYLSFFDELKLLTPDNCADVILTDRLRGTEIVIWVGIYFAYVIGITIGTCHIFKRKDIK